MLILRIRQAEVALDDGRLDEAFELIRPESARSHRRGQRMMGRLVRALLKRGQSHLADRRYLAALADCEKAQQLGGNVPEIVELRRAAGDAMLDQQKVVRRSAQVLAAAQGHIDRGELSRGAQLLAGLKNDESRAVLLMNDIEAKRERLERAPDLREQLQKNLETGRLDLAELLGAQLQEMGDSSVESQQLLRAIDQCRHAWNLINAGDLRGAEEVTRRLSNVIPKANWLTETAMQLSEMARLMGEVRSGPLGMMQKGGATLRDTLPHRPAPDRVMNSEKIVTGQSLPSKFILRVDGAGSFLVLRQASITVGPVSSSRMPDVGVVCEPGLPVATIDRIEDGYFIRGTVGVNDKGVQSKLLASGDAIALSPRCRLSFALPHVASTTAVLDLTSARYPRGEIRRIILLDRDLVIGPGSNSHVRVDHLAQPIVLRLRGDRLMGDQGELPIGQTVKAGNVSFVISNA